MDIQFSEHREPSRLSSTTDTETDDSGIITDIGDTSELSPSDDLTFDFDYNDLLLELSDAGFSEIPNREDFQEYDSAVEEEMDEITDENYITETRHDSIAASNKNINIKNKVVDSPTYDKSDYNHIKTDEIQVENKCDGDISEQNNDLQCTPSQPPLEDENPKLTSFSREQAREWRRKRILNSHQSVKTSGSSSSKTAVSPPANLKPLLPLPGVLRPPKGVKNRSKLEKSKEKLLDPLQGGEKIRSTRGAQAMKLRALPESFWKEPSSVHTSSLARSNYNVLPPIFSAEGKSTSTEEVMNVRPVTPPDERSRSPRHSPRSQSPGESPRHRKRWKMTSPPDTELLFSLFDHLENKIDERLIVRRGRPRKVHVEKIPPPVKNNNGEDPCIVDNLATKLFPDLSLSGNNQEKNSLSNFAIVRIKKGENTIEFPAIQAAENYSTILNELVTHM